MFPFHGFSNQVHCSNSMLNPSVNILKTKLYFSGHIIHSSVNFIWFTLLNQQNFDDRTLFSSGAFCLICCRFEPPQN